MELYCNVFSDCDLVTIGDTLSELSWHFGGQSSSNSKHKFWYMELSTIPFFNTHLVKKIESILNKELRLLRLYANGHLFGGHGDFHQDSTSDNDITVLFYFNPFVSEDMLNDYGGYTQFKIKDEHIVYSVEPRHNSFIVFPATMWHRGLAPFCPSFGLRITIAFKFEVLQDKKPEICKGHSDATPKV